MSDPAPEPRTEPPPRFCGACGAPRAADASECAACTLRAQRPPRPQQPGVASRGGRLFRLAIALYLVFLLISLAAAIGLSVVGLDHHAGVLWIELGAMLLQAGAVCVFLPLAWTQVRPAFTTWPRWTWFLGAAGGGVLTFALATLLLLPWTALLGGDDLRLSDPFLAAGLGWTTVVLAIAVHPALVEEAAFRGVVQGGLQGVLRPSEAIIVGAVLFAVLHLSPAAFPHLLIMALAMGVMRERCGSVYPGMALHAVHNGLCIVGEAWDFGG